MLAELSAWTYFENYYLSPKTTVTNMTSNSKLDIASWHRRVSRDLNVLLNDDSGSFLVTDYSDDLTKFEILLYGPPDSPYSGGQYDLFLTISRHYPTKPPRAHYQTQIFHPNISSAGAICVDFLEDRYWSSGTTLLMVVEGLRSLLALPNPDSPLNADAASMMYRNMDMFNITAATFAHVFADAPDSIPEEYKAKIDLLCLKTFWTREKAVMKLAKKLWVVNDCYRLVTSHAAAAAIDEGEEDEVL